MYQVLFYFTIFFTSSAVASGRYEIACVLFNMAAMQSQIGANQNPKADDGLKAAAKYFMVTRFTQKIIKNSVVIVRVAFCM